MDKSEVSAKYSRGGGTARLCLRGEGFVPLAMVSGHLGVRKRGRDVERLWDLDTLSTSDGVREPG